MNHNRQILAFLTIMKSKNADDLFVKLLKESKTAVGEFYALLGLFECNNDYYKSILNSFDMSKKIIVKTTPNADWFVPVSTFSELIKVIENGWWLKNIHDIRKTQEW